MDSPTTNQNNSSSGFANEPLLALLKTPFHTMTEDQKRAYALELRTLAKSPQSLGKKLRAEGEARERKADGGAKKVTAGKASFEDMMKDLEGT